MRASAVLCLFLAALCACSRSGRGAGAGGWPTADPASHGMDPAALDAIDAEFTSGAHGFVDGFLVARDGRLLYERSYDHEYDSLFAKHDGPRGPYNYYDPDWHPYHRRGDLHTLQSATKSVASALIGIAVGRGEIPDPDIEVLQYFEGIDVPHLDARKKRITLRHLLTMTAGLAWDEDSFAYTDPRNDCARMEASADWVRYVLSKPMAHEPGAVFAYNSGASELLAHILWKATGVQADDYAREHLFSPLGIERLYWKRTPGGLPDTEGGLYLTRSDLAKIGLLYLRDGVWEGRRLLPEGWVTASTAPASNPAWKEWPELRYGFQWWVAPAGGGRPAVWMMLGYGGQRLIAIPDLDLVAVFTGWNVYPEHEALDPLRALSMVLGAAR